MSDEFQMRLCSSKVGRIIIHLLCFIRDHQVSRHYAGIAREFSYV